MRLGTLRRVVIADAGPLIGLARFGRLDLLRALFGGVTLTTVVAAEIGDDPRDVCIHPRPGSSAIAEALGAGWLRIASPSGLPDIEPLIPGVAPASAARSPWLCIGRPLAPRCW